jgi:hypothetical protein
MRTPTRFAIIALMSLAAVGCGGLTEPELLFESGTGTGLDDDDPDPSIFVYGAVTDSASKPVEGVKVTLVKGDSALAEDHTSDHGQYVVGSSSCHIRDDYSVYFELGGFKREVDITEPPCQIHAVHITSWPTG